MNHSQARRYLPFLVNEGYLQPSSEGRGRVVYTVTERGEALLRLLNALVDAMYGPADEPENAIAEGNAPRHDIYRSAT